MDPGNHYPFSTRRWFAALAWLLPFGAISGCNPFAPEPHLTPMAVEPRGEPITVTRAGNRVMVTDRFDLEPGDVIETRDSFAALHLEGDRYVTLAPVTRVTLLDGKSLEETGGALVAEVSEQTTVVLEDVEATTKAGTLRIERDEASAAVSVLGGAAALRAPGQLPVEINRLFEASVAAGEVLEPRPYRVDEEDAWDRRYLGPVVELELQLQRYSLALEAQTEGRRPPASFVSNLAGDEAVELFRRYLVRERPTSDLIVGLTIATLDDARSLEESLSKAFYLRDRGGGWGVVASLMGVEGEPLLASLERLGSNLLGAAEGGASGIRFGPPDGADASGSGDAPGGRDREADHRPAVGGCDNLIDCTLQHPLPSDSLP
jgi:hypothetical protein